MRQFSRFASFGVALNIGLLVFLLVVVQSAERGGRRVQGTDLYAGFKSPCGNAEQVAKRVGSCVTPLFELLEGRFPDPKDDDDIVSACARFNTTEQCARKVSKDCLGGLQKTAVSSVGSAVRRFRLGECKSQTTRVRYLEPFKCAIKEGPEIRVLYRNLTGMLQGIRDLDITPEAKIVKMCCVLNRMDKKIAEIYDKDCPKGTQPVLSIVHAVTDDARNLLCLNPKCDNALDSVLDRKIKESQNLIEPIMQILFQIKVN